MNLTGARHNDPGGEPLTLNKFKAMQREFYSKHGVDYDPQLAIKHGESYARAARVIAQARTAHFHPADLTHGIVQQLKSLTDNRDALMPGMVGGVTWISTTSLKPGQLMFSDGKGHMTLLNLYGAPDNPKPETPDDGGEDPPSEEAMDKNKALNAATIMLIIAVALAVLGYSWC